MHIEKISRKLFSIVKDLDCLTTTCSENSISKCFDNDKVKKRTNIKKANDLRNFVKFLI